MEEFTPQSRISAICVQLFTDSSDILEFVELSRNAGFDIIETFPINDRHIHPHKGLSKGKLSELAELMNQHPDTELLLDFSLSPTQTLEIGDALKCNPLDRQGVIIEIFSQRARTKEAQVQVELAKLSYEFPRLKRAWTHLSRQKGGAKGTRGEGEKQLEVDRRLHQSRMTKLRQELKKIRKQRATTRQKRSRSSAFRVSLVGYTNAGKSSLLNSLSNSGAFVQNAPFATLDPQTKRVSDPNGKQLIISDTVGFIRQLPPSLIESFKATLEELSEAQLLLHVVDLSDDAWEKHMVNVEETLEELELLDAPRVLVGNKTDKVGPAELEARSLLLQSKGLPVFLSSVEAKQGIAELRSYLFSRDALVYADT